MVAKIMTAQKKDMIVIPVTKEKKIYIP